MSQAVQTFPTKLPTEDPESWQFAPMRIKDEHARLRAIIRHNRWVRQQEEIMVPPAEKRRRVALSIKERLEEYYKRLRG